MNNFINEYLHEAICIFTEFVKEAGIKPKIFICGRNHNWGFLTSIDENGVQDLERRFLIPPNEYSILFNGLECPNGDYLLYGGSAADNQANDQPVPNWLIRIDEEGNSLWSKKYFSEQTNNPFRLLQLTGDTYLLLSSHKMLDGSKKLEITKIDSDGNLIKSVRLGIEQGVDIEGIGITHLQEGFLLYGNTNADGQENGFIVFYTNTLILISKRRIGTTSIDKIEAVIKNSDNQIIIVGTTKHNVTLGNQTFIIALSGNETAGTIVQGTTINIFDHNEENRKIIQKHDKYYILGHLPITSISYVICLDNSLNLQWVKSFDLDVEFLLTDIIHRHDDEIWLCGFTPVKPIRKNPLLIKTDCELNTCKTIDLNQVMDGSIEMEVMNWEVESVDLDMIIEEVDIMEIPSPSSRNVLCPIKDFILRDNPWLQSPFLHLKSVGSLGINSSKGILLRWFLLGDLGDNHLPKGGLAMNYVNFNKPNDYVCIYRAPYPIDGKQRRTLNLGQETPFFVKDDERFWVYKLNNGIVFYLHFHNPTQYQNTRSTINPNSSPSDFLQDYGDNLLELVIKDELAFAIDVDLSSLNQQLLLRVETWSVEASQPLSEKSLSARKSFGLAEANNIRIESENIQSIRFRIQNGVIGSFHFETYEAFFRKTEQENKWFGLGQFALTTDDAEAFRRLEEAPRFQVNWLWKRFNNGRTTWVPNFQEKWQDTDWGLKEGVKQYLALSEDLSNPKAILEINGQEVQDGAFDVSLLNLLNIAASDYHVARMLGLGHVDTPIGNDDQRYIYLAEYITAQNVDGSELERQHLYMNAPVSKQEERLPQLLDLERLDYGLEVSNGSSQPFQLTDNEGYTPDGQARYVNLYAKLQTNFSQSSVFFQPSNEFSILDFSAPVLAGIEYRKQGMPAWRAREVAYHDFDKIIPLPPAIQKDFPPVTFETPIMPFNEESTQPLFVHKEVEEGFHEYAFYPIDIFSRSGPNSGLFATDETIFKKRNSLIPPTLRAQLIQKEYPLLFTTQAEQDMLDGISGDKTLVRVMFDYHQVHERNYRFANKIEFLFRETLPLEIMGGIATVQSYSDELLNITTQSYTYASTGETLLPTILPSQKDNFIGSSLIIKDSSYKIETVILPNASGQFPSFKVRKNEVRITNEIDGTIITNQNWQSLEDVENELFFVVENLSKPDAWSVTPNPLTFQAQIGDSSWLAQEQTFVNEDGENYKIKLRGFWETAKIEIESEVDNGDTKTRTYSILFDSFILNNHPQFSTPQKVNWYKGSIRIPFENYPNKAWKALDIKELRNVGDNQFLEIIAIETATEDQKILEGTSILVNLFPGYLLYLSVDNPHNFNEVTTGANGAESKTTLLGARSVDVINNCRSDISTPAKIIAEQIIEPLIPLPPIGPIYATPPDIYKKSNYTFSVDFQHEFYMAAFYRADINTILKALYKSSSLQNIREKLSPYTLEERFSDRWLNLLGFDYSASGEVFQSFILSDGSFYALPNPDNSENGFDENGTEQPGNIIEKLKRVIWNVFLPLTEQPLYFEHIKEAPYQPSSHKQTIRDKYGKLIAPSHPDYKQAPMAKKDGVTIQFTDFTLDGGMSLDTAYCYFVREIGNKMEMGDPSSILGPIQLVDKSAPPPLAVRKVITQLANPIGNIPAAVRFKVLKPTKNHRIEKFRIYRVNNEVNALSVRTMVMVKELNLTDITIQNGVIELIDDFAGEPFVPFGEQLIYRLAGVKKVEYENISGTQVIEEVQSIPTKILQAALVDNFNPEAPKLEVTSGSIVNGKWIGLVLSWNKTAYNAVYHLFKMTQFGTWQKVFEIESNDAMISYIVSNDLDKVDEEGNTIYHRYKITVVNSSGLLNLGENILTI